MKNSRASYLVQATKLKLTLVKRLSAEYANVARSFVYQAVTEADALASLTVAPLLFLPALAEEKVQELATWSARQHSLWAAESGALKGDEDKTSAPRKAVLSTRQCGLAYC